MRQRPGTLLPAVIVILAIAAFVGMLAFAMWPKPHEFDVQAPVVRTKTTNTAHTNTNTANVNAVVNTNTSSSLANTNSSTGVTAEWKTYSDSDKIYSIKYPPSFTAEKCSSTEVNFAPLPQGATSLCDGIYAGIFIQTRTEATAEAAFTADKNNVARSVTPTESTITIGGTIYHRLGWQNKGALENSDIVWDVVYVQTGSHVYAITNTDSNQKDTFSTMLGTLVFTSTTTAWKTYTNSKYNYSLQYPTDLKVTMCDSNDPMFVAIAASDVRCGTEWFGPGFSFSAQKSGFSQSQSIVNAKSSLINPTQTAIVVDNQAAVRVSGVEKTGPDVMGGGGKYFDEVVLTNSGVGYIIIDRSSTKEAYRPNDFTDLLKTLHFTPPTAEWKAYTNTTYRFALKYPNDGWIFSDAKVPYGSATYDNFGWSKNIVPANPSESSVQGKFGITVYPRKGTESAVATYLRLVPTSFSQAAQTSVTVGGVTGTKVIGVPAMVNYNAVFLAKGNYVFELSQYSGLTDQEFSDILTTFTFTK